MHEIDVFAAFERFQEHLPIGRDLTLMILKGHLLIEEQVNILIENRVPNSGPLTEAELTAHQKLCLAEAVIDERYPNGETDWLWPAVKKLNKLRNDIAHNLSMPGIHDRVRDFVSRVPEKTESKDLCQNFEFALWVTCVKVHLLVSPPDPTELDRNAP